MIPAGRKLCQAVRAGYVTILMAESIDESSTLYRLANLHKFQHSASHATNSLEIIPAHSSTRLMIDVEQPHANEAHQTKSQ